MRRQHERLYFFKALTSRVSLEISLEEVFLWKTPLDWALWIKGIAFDKAFWAPSTSFFSIADLTLFTFDLTVDLTLRFRSRLFSFCLVRLIADKCVANVRPPYVI
jgi:hypothetical protein